MTVSSYSKRKKTLAIILQYCETIKFNPGLDKFNLEISNNENRNKKDDQISLIETVCVKNTVLTRLSISTMIQCQLLWVGWISLIIRFWVPSYETPPPIMK